MDIIRRLSECARTLDEIEQMYRPVALLIVGFKVDPAWLVPRFDQILRLYGEPVGSALKVADTIAATSQQMVGTFTEAVDALIVAGGGLPPEELPATA